MVKRIFRFIFAILMLAVLFVPLGYIDSSSVITKIVTLFKVEYFGLVYFAYVWIFVINFVVSLIGAVTDNCKCMSISRNTSFICAILLFNYAIMSNFNILTAILVGLGIVVLLFESIAFFAGHNVFDYKCHAGPRKKYWNDVIRFFSVLVSFICIGINQDGYYSPMYYHQNLLKEYGRMASGINLMVCFLFLITIALSLISWIQDYYRVRTHASVFAIVLYYVLFFIPFYVYPDVAGTAMFVTIGAVIGLINEIYFMIKENRYGAMER